jgi:regulatory protein
VAEAEDEGEANQRVEHALGLAWRYLNRRERTVAETRRHLEQRGVRPDAAQAAIDVLQRDGYLDDARYVTLFAQDKRELQGWGAERITQALRQRGIPPELLDQALEPDQQSELERALSFLRQRFATPPAERRDRERALGMLVRRGYELELALQAISDYRRG